MNKIFITGRLTRNPELRHTDSGMAICRFTVASNKHIKGEQKTTFINIVTFNKIAENCEKYLFKGNKVAVVGELEIRQYTDNEGNNRTATEVLANEVEFLSEKTSGSNSFDGPSSIEIDENDLPF